MAKPKQGKAPAKAVENRGGGDRGAGRKPKGATPTPKPAAPVEKDKRVQQSLTALLGFRETPAGTAKRPAVFVADVIRWQSSIDGGDAKDEKQVKDGPVQYDMDKETEYILLRAGSAETHHRYWIVPGAHTYGRVVPP